MWGHVYALDIETDTSDLTPAEEEAGYLPRGLDPRIGRIVNVGLCLDGDTLVLKGDERDILLELEKTLNELPPGLLSGWRTGPFDLPFINYRAAKLNVPTGLRVQYEPQLGGKYKPIGGHEGTYIATWFNQSPIPHAHLDIAVSYERVAEEHEVQWSLKPVARALGMSPIEVDRTKIHLLSEAEADAYVASDAYVTYKLTLRVLGLHG
jgi:DNA polymerase elongation subunit (family B)